MYAVLRSVLKVPGRASEGRCIGCQCTEEHACEGGCHWVDSTHLLCSTCFHDPAFWAKHHIGFSRVDVERPKRKGKKKTRKAAS